MKIPQCQGHTHDYSSLNCYAVMPLYPIINIDYFLNQLPRNIAFIMVNRTSLNNVVLYLLTFTSTMDNMPTVFIYSKRTK